MASKRRGHGEGSVYQLADGTWRAALTLPAEQGGGRRSFRGRSRVEVQRKLAAARRALEDGLPLGDRAQTLEAYLASWLEAIKPTIEHGAWKRHEEFARLHIGPALGRVRLSALSAQAVQALYAERLSSGALSPTTVHHLHTSLHKALRDAERLGLVARNVCDLVKAPRIAETDMHPLSREEARVLLDVASGDALYALYALALASGMRQGELLGLRWADVDLEARDEHTRRSAPVVRVRWQLKREEGQFVWKPPKTRRSRRQIALPEATVEALSAHRTAQTQQRLRLGAAWEDNDLVFATQSGRPLSARNVYRAFKGLLLKGALPDVRFHDLRHTAATLLLAARVNPKVVSEMLGHASVAITLDVYSHVLPDMQQDAATVMGTVLYG